MKRARAGMAAIITAVLCFLTVGVHAAPSDIAKHAARNEINRWIDRGVFKVKSNGQFKPNEYITRAELVAVVNRVMKYQDKTPVRFSDMWSRHVYAEDMVKAVNAGIIKLDASRKVRPDVRVTRQEAAAILARAFSLEAKNKKASDKYKDASKISSGFKDSVNAMVENGYMTAKSGNLFSPSSALTRAEAVLIVDKLVRGFANRAGSYTGVIAGNMVVNSPDVKLKSMTIKGNLYLAQGIGSGDITLDKVTVQGKTVVSGGGENSIIIKNSSLKGNLVVCKADGKIRIVAEGSTDIAAVRMQSGGLLVEKDTSGKAFGGVTILGEAVKGQEIKLDGDFEAISVEVPGIELRIIDGLVGKLEIKKGADGSVIQIDENAQVKLVTLNSGTSITGEGKVGTAQVNTSGVTMDLLPDKLYAMEGVELPPNLQAIAEENGVSGTGTDEGNGTETAEEDGGAGAEGADGGSGAGSGIGGGAPGGGAPGGDTGEQTLQVLSASAVVGGSSVSATKQGGQWVVNLAGKANTAMLTDINITATSDVVSGSVTLSGITRSISFSNGAANINIHNMLGVLDTGTPGVSIASIKAFGLTTFTVTLNNNSSQTSSITISLSIP